MAINSKEDLTDYQYIIIGDGIAGISAAEAIFKTHTDASILILSEEEEMPYYRMSLTRYLAGEIDETKLDLHPSSWYDEKNITLGLKSVVSELHLDKKEVVLTNKSVIGYGKLVLATGASPFVPPFPGANLKNVVTLRTHLDTKALLDLCCDNMPIVCIGGGLLGLEIAGALAHQGASVTVLEALDWLLPRQLDEPASQILEKMINTMGISVKTKAHTQALLGDSEVTSILLDDGTIIPANIVVVSAGVRPNVNLAKKAGLEVNRGILVNDYLQTSNPDVFAAGDVTEHKGVLYGLWLPAKSQGTIAGLCAAGEKAVFTGIHPSTKLKVLGIDLFSIGQYMAQNDTDIVLSETKDGNYASFVFHNGILAGSILLCDTSLAGKVKKAVEAHADFSVELAAGLTIPDLKQLLTK